MIMSEILEVVVGIGEDIAAAIWKPFQDAYDDIKAALAVPIPVAGVSMFGSNVGKDMIMTLDGDTKHLEDAIDEYFGNESEEHAVGGDVMGRPGTDNVHAKLTRGEIVMNSDASRHNRKELMAMNAGSRYYDGSVNYMTFGDRINDQSIINKVIPGITRAKRRGFGVDRQW